LLRTSVASVRVVVVATLLSPLVADIAKEGRDIVLSMLVVGLIFIGVILLGQLAEWMHHRSRR
jgi:heme/copper-type cytochrome/quinol oxidase subunit 2